MFHVYDKRKPVLDFVCITGFPLISNLIEEKNSIDSSKNANISFILFFDNSFLNLLEFKFLESRQLKVLLTSLQNLVVAMHSKKSE